LAAVHNGIPPLMPFYFDAFEFSNALKPFLVRHLLAGEFERVIYLDADILPTAPFTPIWDELGSSALLLTVHHLQPPPLDLGFAKEVGIVDMGVFNGGFAAWQRGEASSKILDWMCERFPIYGFCDRAADMFVDQKLLPLVQLYFPDHVRISRNPRLNVAWWNIHERAVTPLADGTSWASGGEPLVFFHLSGFRSDHPKEVNTHLSATANADLLEKNPWLASVLEIYRDGLAHHQSEPISQPYRYREYRGITLCPEMRRLLFKTGRLDRSSVAFRRVQVRRILKIAKRKIVDLLR